MKIISLCGKDFEERATVCALGMFDGVHMGHRRIISAAKSISTELGIPTSVLIFSSSPHGSTELLPLSDRLTELKNAGADYAFVYDFDEIREMSADDFITELLCNELGVKGVAAGYNYRFGKGGNGDDKRLLELAKANGIKATVCEEVDAFGEPVSSTRIRKLLMNGEIEMANRLLTYPYYVNAPVLHGKELGRRIGIPTINQEIPFARAEMQKGIYYTKTYVDGREFLSVSNLGERPTVENTAATNLETHILDFDGDLYGKTIKVAFFGKGRPEQKFESVEELRREIMLDCERAREFFK
nr:riboflavin biosynthesis protein RibF [Clostridia bacterium]